MFKVSYLKLVHMKHYHKILLPDSVADSFAIQKGNREFTYINLASEKRYCLEVKRTDFDEIEIGFTSGLYSIAR